jgi:hypothetical protein
MIRIEQTEANDFCGPASRSDRLLYIPLRDLCVKLVLIYIENLQRLTSLDAREQLSGWHCIHRILEVILPQCLHGSRHH